MRIIVKISDAEKEASITVEKDEDEETVPLVEDLKEALKKENVTEGIDESQTIDSSAVAIGDPKLGALLREACLELIASGLVEGMQDMGAAGLTCSSCETATRSGTGIEIDVALIPQREKNMTPYEILLSEVRDVLHHDTRHPRITLF